MRSYKDSMNQIVMTDALKERIRQQAAADSRKTTRPAYRRRYMVCANIAACLLLLLCTQMRLSDFLIPTQNVSMSLPTATATPQAAPEDTVLPVQTPVAKAVPSHPGARETDAASELHTEIYTETVVSESENVVQTEDVEKQETSDAPLRTGKPAEDLSVGNNTLADSDTAEQKKGMEESVPMAPPQATPPLAQGAPSSGSGGSSPSGGGGGGGNSSGITGWVEATGGIQQLDSLETLRAACGFTFRPPSVLPTGCTLRHMELLWDNLVQLTYDGSAVFTFRAAAGEDDVSGDYNDYDEITTQTIRQAAVSLRGNAGLVYTAVWQEAGVSYAILTDGISQEQMLQLIASMQ